MTPTPYKDFIAGMRAELWPHPGEPASLRASHNRYFQAAMMDLTTHVKGLSDRNVSVKPACSCFVQNGVTVTDAPVGEIRYVYTIPNDDWANPVYYDPVDQDEIKRWQSRLTVNWTTPANLGLPALQQGMKYHEASMDSAYGRARLGFFSLYRKRLYIAPWLQSNEKLIIEWDGARTKWEDDDLVDLEEWNHKIVTAIQYYVQWQHETFFGDANEALKFKKHYDMQFADCVHDADRRTRLKENNQESLNRLPTAAEITSEAVPPVVTTQTSFVFANISDYGVTNANPPDSVIAKVDVAAMVKSWDDNNNFIIITNGDNSHKEIPDYPASVGLLYGEYVTNSVASNRLWPAIGNHDYSANGSGTLNDYFAYFKALATKGRYYDLVWGPCHFFFLNASNRAGQTDWPETDGFIQDTAGVWRGQAGWLKSLMTQSVARWKIVVLHDPPYSSSDSTPGFTEYRLPFADWGADLVLSGNDHVYERLLIGNLAYIVNGTGGGSLNAFGVPVTGSEKRISEYGAMKGTVTCDSLKLEWFNKDRVLKDTLELLK